MRRSSLPRLLTAALFLLATALLLVYGVLPLAAQTTDRYDVTLEPGDTNVIVKWSEVKDLYLVEYRAGESGTPVRLRQYFDDEGGAHAARFWGLTNGFDYQFRVKRGEEESAYLWSPWVSAIPVPSSTPRPLPVQKPVLTQSPGEIAVTWKRATNTFGRPDVIKWHLKYKPFSGWSSESQAALSVEKHESVLASTTTEMAYTITELVDVGDYYVCVWAENEHGTSAPPGAGADAARKESCNSIWLSEPYRPPPPMEEDDRLPERPNLSGVVARDGALHPIWVDPYYPVTGYDIHYTSASSTDVDNEAAAGADPATAWVDTGFSGVDTSFTITGLDNGTTYRVRIRALNDNGASEWVFGEGTPREDVDPTPTATPTQPTGPTNNGGSNSGSGGGGASGGGGSGDNNQPPRFDEQPPVSRSVPENSPAGTAVGEPVAATDPDGDRVAYRLIGPDMAMFDIDENTGQITVGEDTALDYEGERNVYGVRVVARDIAGSGETTGVDVTIVVRDVRLPGMADDYDANANEEIELDEALPAASDYFDERLTLEEVLGIVRLYFDG